MSFCSNRRSGSQIEQKIAQKPAKYLQNYFFIIFGKHGVGRHSDAKKRRA